MERKSKVYRIQDAHGRGPWKPGFSQKWVRKTPDYELVPWYVDWVGFNPTLEISAKEVAGTGCRTIEQLKRWFNHDEYHTLRILGYRSVEIEVDRILRGNNKQVVFARGKPLNEDVVIFDLYGIDN